MAGCSCCPALPAWEQRGSKRTSLNGKLLSSAKWPENQSGSVNIAVEGSSSPIYASIDHDVIYFTDTIATNELIQSPTAKPGVNWRKAVVLPPVFEELSIGEHGFLGTYNNPTTAVLYCDKDGVETEPYRPIGDLTIDGATATPTGRGLDISRNSLHATLKTASGVVYGDLEITESGSNWDVNVNTSSGGSLGSGDAYCCATQDGSVYYYYTNLPSTVITKNPSGIFSAFSKPADTRSYLIGYPGGLTWYVGGEGYSLDGRSKYGAAMFDHVVEGEWISSGDGIAYPTIYPCNGGYIIQMARVGAGGGTVHTRDHWSKMFPGMDVDELEINESTGHVLSDRYYFNYDLKTFRKREGYNTGNLSGGPSNFFYNLSLDSVAPGEGFVCKVLTRDATPEHPALGVNLSGSTARYEARFFLDTNADEDDTESTLVPSDTARILDEEDFAVVANGTVTHDASIAVTKTASSIYSIDVTGVDGGEDGGEIRVTIAADREILNSDGLPLGKPPIPMEYYIVSPDP